MVLVWFWMKVLIGSPSCWMVSGGAGISGGRWPYGAEPLGKDGEFDARDGCHLLHRGEEFVEARNDQDHLGLRMV